MINFKKRVILLALFFVFIATTAFAQTIDWNAANITITTEAELRELADRVNGTNDFTAKTFENQTITLGNDIALTSEWVPIGNPTRPFRGLFDGNGKSIWELSVSGVQYAGLFGYIGADGQIINLIVNVNKINAAQEELKLAYYVGGLAGYYSSAKEIRNCVVNIKGRIDIGTPLYSVSRSGPSYSGGLVGYAKANITINNSHTAGDVYATSEYDSSSYSGGLVGYADTDITINNSSHYFGNVYAVVSGSGHSYSGGLVGYAKTNITISYSYKIRDYVHAQTMNLIGSSAFSGGLVGYASLATITNSYASCLVYAQTLACTNFRLYSGGLVGYANTNITISNSYTNSYVYSSSSRVFYHVSNSFYSGGLVGYVQSPLATINNSYTNGMVGGVGEAVYKYIGEIFGDWNSGANTSITSVFYNSEEANEAIGSGTPTNIDIQGVPLSALKTQSTFNGWDFKDVWAINPNINDGFPYLHGTGVGVKDDLPTTDSTRQWEPNPDLADGTHQWERYVDDIGSTVRFFNVAPQDINFVLNRVNKVGSNVGIASYPNANYTDFTGIEITYSSNRDLWVYLFTSDLKSEEMYYTILSAGINKTSTLSHFKQGWFSDFQDIKTFDRSKIIGVGIISDFGGISTSVSVSKFVLNGVVMNNTNPTVCDICNDDPCTCSDNVSIRNKNRDSKYGILLDSIVVKYQAKILVKTPESATINLRITDNLGNLVFETSGKSTDAFAWNLTNKLGRFVENGSYLIVAEAKSVNGRIYRYTTKVWVKK